MPSIHPKWNPIEVEGILFTWNLSENSVRLWNCQLTHSIRLLIVPTCEFIRAIIRRWPAHVVLCA